MAKIRKFRPKDNGLTMINYGVATEPVEVYAKRCAASMKRALYYANKAVQSENARPQLSDRNINRLWKARELLHTAYTWHLLQMIQDAETEARAKAAIQARDAENNNEQ